MQTGIIGLAQTGKTSLFRILTGARVEAKAADFAVGAILRYKGNVKNPTLRKNGEGWGTRCRMTA